ncbi:hypothetical protein AB0F15_29625 [Amycolatopsis sp. NPDC026612]|uniref:hypothetical protein n=1 Tax=Amycolatopsis sp. NPDC026612 TaxID=3155466 RepID=UPI0033F2690E
MTVLCAVVLSLAGAVAGSASAGASVRDGLVEGPPPGYGGPVSTCTGVLVYDAPLFSAAGGYAGSYVEVHYTSADNGTLCAKTFDNIEGRHHMEIVLRRTTWQTPWADSGTYETYAGGIQHFGTGGNVCVTVFSRVTVNGVNYEDRIGLVPGYAGDVCWLP